MSIKIAASYEVEGSKIAISTVVFSSKLLSIYPNWIAVFEFMKIETLDPASDYCHAHMMKMQVA